MHQTDVSWIPINLLPVSSTYNCGPKPGIPDLIIMYQTRPLYELHASSKERHTPQHLLPILDIRQISRKSRTAQVQTTGHVCQLYHYLSHSSCSRPLGHAASRKQTILRAAALHRTAPTAESPARVCTDKRHDSPGHCPFWSRWG